MDRCHYPWRRRLLAVNVILLFAAATFCRAYALDHVPGLNGDEAWQGVQAQRLLRGESITWRTPTDNPINPLTFLPLVALHAWLPPSITLLRLTALVSGLAALGVNYWLCRRVFDRQLAAVSTILLAVLPAAVAYSRFAWDASQSVLVTLPVMYCALGAVREPPRRLGWLISAVAALCLAVLVHPTNVFAAPLIAVAAAWCWREELTALGRRLRRLGQGVRHPIIACAIAAIPLLGLAWAAARSPQVVAAAERIVSPSQAAAFAGRVVDLLSGTTIYQYIPGMQLSATAPATLIYRAAAWTFLAAAGYGLWRCLSPRRRTAGRVLLAGLGLSAAAFYVVAGPQSIQPHVERYGMWMIAPSVLLLAMGVRWWLQRGDMSTRLRPAVALLVPWVMLAGFSWYYLRPLRLGLGETHLAFRTAAMEPKLAALRAIKSRSSEQTTQIVAHGWWVYWPMAYLAGSESRLKVVPRDVPGEKRVELDRDASWDVGFVGGIVPGVQTGGQSHFGLDKNWDSPQPTIQSSVIRDAANRPLLRIVPAMTTVTSPSALN